MSGAFQYRPKFVDIRVRPPKPEAEDDAATPDLKPGERRCDWPDCRQPASARAPKSREMLGQHYWFCQAHAGEYNKNWDFFAGMTEQEVADAQAARLTGERPTWQFKASRLSREAAAFAARMAGGGRGAGGYADPLGLFGGARSRTAAPESARRLGRLERRALEELDLQETADGPLIRARYLELVKRFHPDANGGDRATEQKLARVLKAYKSLQKAKLV